MLPPPTPRRFALVTALALLAIGALYLPALQGGVLGWDDAAHLGEPLLQRPFLEALREAFAAPHQQVWWPVLWLTWWAQARPGGLDPAALHAVDLALFLASAGLLVALLRRFGLGAWAALLAGVLWAVHPLRVESVAWLTARKDVLSLFFAVLAALVATPSSGRPGARRLVLAHLAFALALLSKSAVAPVAAVLWVATWAREGAREATRRFGGFFALAAVDAAVSVLLFRAAGPEAELIGGPLEALRLGLWSHGLWLAHALWPAGLAAIYPKPESAWPLATLGLAALGLAAVAIYLRRPGRAALALGALWLLPLLPVMGPVRVAFWGADRYALVSSLALAILAALLVERLARRAPAAWLLAAPAIVALAALTHLRIPAWHDDIALWQHDLARGDHPQRRSQLAAAYGSEGRFAEALRELRRAEALAPASATIKAHRMFAELAAAGLTDARRRAGALLEPPPRAADGWERAMTALLEANEWSLALDAAGVARGLGSKSPRVALGEIYARHRAGDRAGAAAAAERAAREHPGLDAARILGALDRGQFQGP